MRAGGSTIALTWHLMQASRGAGRPSRIVVTNRSQARLDHIREIHAEIGSHIPCDYVLAPTAADNDLVMAGLKPGSLVINATGFGKDAPCSPVTEAVIAAATDLRVISRNGTRVDNPPVALLVARGIELRRAEGTNARAVAELALTLALAGLRDVVPTHAGCAKALGRAGGRHWFGRDWRGWLPARWWSIPPAPVWCATPIGSTRSTRVRLASMPPMCSTPSRQSPRTCCAMGWW